MGEERAGQLDANLVETLPLGLVDGHGESRGDGKLAPLEDEGKLLVIDVQHNTRYKGDATRERARRDADFVFPPRHCARGGARCVVRFADHECPETTLETIHYTAPTT